MTDLEQIKAKIDLADYIGKVVELRKAGTNYKGLCPFHGEKTPSFMVSPDKQIWHCFGCGRGGDVFRFVMEKDGLEFVEALKLLAEQTGIELTNVPKGASDERRTLLSLNEWAAKVFQKALNEGSEGRGGKQYLVGRGLTPETIEKFRLGWAPSGGKVLVEALSRRGFSPEVIEKAGLGVWKGKYLYDKFVGRVMFPLTDNSGRVVGFTGRVLPVKVGSEPMPKYLNSPETAIFHKGDMLYGLDLAKSAMQQSRTAVLVEGQMDTISSHQAGVENTIGISGTALTESQLQILSRYVDQLVLALDADAAGGEATKRAIEMAGQFGLSLRIALLGDHKDPDSIIKVSPEAWQATVENAVSVMDFYFETVVAGRNLEMVEDKKAVVRQLLGVIVKLTDPIERDHYIKRLGRTVGIESGILYDALKTVRATKTVGVKSGLGAGLETPTGMSREERAVVLPVVFPGLLPVFMAEAGKIKWASSLSNTIYHRLLDCYNTGTQVTAEQFAASLQEPDRTNFLEMMLIAEQEYASLPAGDIERELRVQLSALANTTYSERRAELAKMIADAEQNKDGDKLRELLAELAKL